MEEKKEITRIKSTEIKIESGKRIDPEIKKTTPTEKDDEKIDDDIRGWMLSKVY